MKMSQYIQENYYSLSSFSLSPVPTHTCQHPRESACAYGGGRKKNEGCSRPWHEPTLAATVATVGPRWRWWATLATVVRPTASLHLRTALGRTGRVPKWQRQTAPASRPIGTPGRKSSGEVCGNSRQPRQSLFSLSEPLRRNCHVTGTATRTSPGKLLARLGRHHGQRPGEVHLEPALVRTARVPAVFIQPLPTRTHS